MKQIIENIWYASPDEIYSQLLTAEIAIIIIFILFYLWVSRI